MAYATGKKFLNKAKLPLMWCSGCGNGITLSAMLRAIEELDAGEKQVNLRREICCILHMGERFLLRKELPLQIRNCTLSSLWEMVMVQLLVVIT